MNKNKAKQSNTRQQFLLTFFEDNGNEHKQVNGFWLVKHWNGNTNDWEVSIYSKEAYKNFSEFNKEQTKLDWIK